MAPHRLLGAILLTFATQSIPLWADEPADAEKPVQAAQEVRDKAPPPPQIANPIQAIIRGFFKGAVPAAKVAPAARAARVRGNVNKVMEDGEGEEQPVRVNPSDRDYIDSRAPHDAKIEHQLSLAQAAIKRNDWKQASALLQQLLDLPEDSLHRLPDGRWQSVRVTASRELGNAPAEVLIGYQQQYGGLAKQILADADAEGDIAGVIRVATRFFHTEAGYQAAERLALVHRDRAEFGIAAQWLDQLLAARVGFTKNPGWKALAAAIYRQAGRAEDAKKLAVGLNSEIASLKIGGQSSDVARWLESLPARSAVKPLTLESWPQFAGTSDRTGLQAGSAPFLMAEWQVPYSSSHGVRQRVKWLMQDLADRDQPLLMSAHPLAIDGKILYRDLRGVHAVDLATGESLWETIEGMSAEKIASGMTTEGEDGEMVALQVVNGFMDPFGGQSGDHHPLTNLMLRDAAYNTLSSDGRQVFLIEDQGILTRQNGGWHWGWDGEQPDPYGFSWTTNRLSSYDLDTGRPLWTVGGPETAEAFQLSLAGVYFHGVPTPDGDDLFVIGSKGDELRLWCLDRRTGGLRWSQLIGYADSRIDQDIARRWMPALPSVSGGVVVCPTNLGWLVAVDRLRQTVLWAVRYQPPQQGSEQQRHPGQQFTPQHELGGQWGASAPLIVGQKVVFAPAEDQFLICVDLVSGAPAWQINREQGQYVAGTTGDAIIIVELQQVCAYAMHDGRKLWTHPFGENARPSGRGAMTETQLFLPLSTGELRTVNLADGKTALQTFVPAGESPLGNLLLHQGRMASLGYEGLTGFRQQDALLAEIRDRKAKNPADPVALLNEAEIHLLNRQAEQAVPLLKGIQAAELPGELAARHHRDLIAGLTAMIRQNLAESEPLLAELSAVAVTPEEKLMHHDLNAERYLAAGSHQAAFEIFWNLAAEPGDDFVIRPDDARVQARRAAWLAGRLHDAWKGASEKDRRRIDELIAARVSQTGGDGAARRRLADTLRFHPQSHGLWRDLIIGDDSSLAELELLRWTESGDRQMAAWAWTWLANLMVELKLPADAAYYASKLEADYAETKLPDGRTGAEAVQFLRTSHQLPADFTAPPPAWDERPLKVVQSMHQYYGQQSQEIGPSSRVPFFESLDIEFLPNEQRLMFESRKKDFRWLAPLRISPVSQHSGFLPAAIVGHSLAVVHQDVLHLLSPVKRQMLWTVSLDGFSDGGLQAYHASRAPMMPMWNAQQSGGGMQAPVLQQYSHRGRLATAQTGYVAVIGRRAVHVLDSRTGTEIWRRNNVTPHSRVIGGPDVLWIVPNNLSQVTAYRTADGTPIAGNKWGELFGRCLGLAGNDLLLAEEGVGLKLLGLNTKKTIVRRFDPLTDKDVWKQEFGTGAMLSRLSDDELLVVPAAGNAEILGVARGERKPLEALTTKDLESRNDCYAVADEDRIFLLVNTQQNGGFQHFAESLPSVRANGMIYAWQRSTGKLIWKHELKNQHLIVERMQSSPVLLFCSREWKQKGNVNFSQLHLAVLHKQTGKLLHESTTPTMYGGFHALAISPNEQSLELQSYNLRVKLVPDDKPAEKPAVQGSD